MGDKQNDLVDGTLVMTISPRADHAISTNFMPKETYGDCVLFVRMKLEEGGQLKLAYNDKAQVGAVAAGPHIRGIQFHPEISGDIAHTILAELHGKAHQQESGKGAKSDKAAKSGKAKSDKAAGSDKSAEAK